MKPNLTIAIPTFKNLRQVLDCLITLSRYVDYPYRVVVINNGPEADGSGRRFEDEIRRFIKLPDMKVIQAEENLGWERAINRAFVDECETEFFCMMNDDLVFIPYHGLFLRKLMEYFKYPEVGAVGPSTNFAMGSQSIFDHRGGGAFETTLLIGFLMIVRSELFSQIGGLDETLPGGDDLDLSILIRKRGYKLIVDRTSYVHHIGQQTGWRVDPQNWCSQSKVETTNNAIIQKHGVKAWYETVQSKISTFAPVSQTADTEGDFIRKWVAGLETGIDIGCGQNKTVPSAVGIDQTPKGQMGNAGGTRGGISQADIVGDATKLPFEDGSQDYIVARHIFEHLLDPLAALNEWKRVLKTGGILAIACPDESACDTMVLDYTHLHAYTPETLTKLLRISGFEVEETELVRPGYSFVLKAKRLWPWRVLGAQIPVELKDLAAV